MGDFTWLQFSDLHFHTGDLYDTQRARQALVKCLAQEQFECDYVFFTGDLVQKNNYENADKHMATIRNEIKVDPNNIFWAVGNHDIRRDSIIRESIITRIRNATNPSTEFQTVMADEESRFLLTHSGMSDYIREYERLFDRRLSPEEISDAHVFYPLEHCNLIVLNTCLTACNKDDFRKLMITEPQLLRIFDKATDKSKPLIVIGHHSKEIFHYGEQKELATLFEDGGVDAYLCGHSHQLGYARFDDTGRDIPQFTCGAGTIGRGDVFTFLHGKYDAARHSVSITPFSYSKNTQRFAKDFRLHRRLIENNSFVLERLKTASAADIDLTEPGFSLEDNDLFNRSQRYYDFLRSEEGRYSYLTVEEQLFASIKRPETRVKGSNTDDKSHGLLEVLKNPDRKNLLIIGDGGMGKTVALLHIWEELLETRTGELPFYVPLNEYRPHPEFIRNYIKLHYDKTDIYGLKRNFVLLLDGLNETSGDIHPLIREIKDVMSQRFDFARIVITSRSGFAPEHQIGSFVPQYLQPLDQQAVLDYLEKKNRKLGDTPIEVLQTPMMLTLFTQTCSVQDAIKNRGLFEFKPNTTRGELLYNYLLCQVANCVLNGRSNEIEAMWHTLFTATPYIAHHMEQSGVFEIDKQDFAKRITEYEKYQPSDKSRLAMPEKLQQYTDRYESISIETEDILVYRQVLLVEEAGQYRFRHQYFRDFFASLHVVNAISNSLTTEPFLLLPEVSKHAWTVYVRDMLGDYYGDYRHKQGYDSQAHTDLHELLGKLRGLPGERCGLTISNIIETWRRARKDCIIGEDLTRLDLNYVPLNGVRLSSNNRFSSFNGSIISDFTLLPQGHLGFVESIVYSPDGGRILSGSGDHTIKEWDRLTGECLRTFDGHIGSVRSVVYSLDGDRILSSSWDSAIKEWDRLTGKCLRIFEGHTSEVRSAVYSPEGDKILTGSGDHTIKEWNRLTGECLRTFEGHTSSVRSAVYSPDGSRILSGSWDRTIKEWDRLTGECIRTFKGHTSEVSTAVYSPEVDRILSGSWDNTIKEWDRFTGECLRTFEGHTSSVRCAIYSPDGGRILSCSRDRTIKEWDRLTGECLRTFEGHTGSVRSVVYSQDGCRILTGSRDSTIKEWDRLTGECLRTLGGNTGSIRSAVYSPEGDRILTGLRDNTIKEWDRLTRECIHTYEGHTSSVRSAVYSPDGDRILSGSWDNTIKEWDRQTEECLRTFEGHANEVCSVEYSPDGGRILSGSWDKTIKEWDRLTGKCLNTFVGHTRDVNSAVYSPDGGRILSGSGDGAIKEWDRLTGICLRTFVGLTSSVRDAVYSPDGGRILAGSRDSIVMEWDRLTEKCIHTYKGHTSEVLSVVYSPNGDRILTGSGDCTVKEWDRWTEVCLRTFEGHTSEVSNAVYSSEVDRILTGSWDGTIKEWDWSSGRLLWSIQNIGGIVITGCDFRGCCFSSPEIEEIVKLYGGRTISPFLTGIRGKYLRGMDNGIDLSLSVDFPQNLILTGQNGSGKTSLLLGIKIAMESFFENGGKGDIAVEFTGGTYEETQRAMQIEHVQGYYRFAYFKSTHLYSDDKTKFWDRLDRTQALIDRLRNEGKNVEAAVHTAWLGRITRMLSELFDTEIELEYKNTYHDVYHVINGKRVPIDRYNLPDGYSAALNIFGTIIGLQKDVSIPFNRMRGLVLIDELEAHLHVRMQKVIFPFLTKTFPKIQFIVTTHSPFILNSASGAVVYDMVSKKVDAPSMDTKYGLQGWTIEEILKNILGQSDDMSKLLSRRIGEFDKFTNESDNTNASKIYYELKHMMKESNPLLKVLRLKLAAIGGLVDDQNS